MTEFVVGAWDVLDMAAGLVLAIVVAVVIYLSMSRPRLRLVATPDGPRATRRDVLRYALTAPVLVLVWYAFFVVILVVGTNDLTGRDIIRVSMAVVIATRVLAHVWHEPSYELAKTVPLTLVALILIAGGVRGQASLSAIITQIFETGVTWPAFLLLLLSDAVITTAWYWLGVRWWHGRGGRIPGWRQVPDSQVPDHGAPAQ